MIRKFYDGHFEIGNTGKSPTPTPQGKDISAMRELIDWLKDERERRNPTTYQIEAKATSLLAKEREQITDAFMEGESNQGSKHPSFYEAMAYFTTHYSNTKP